MSTIRDSVQDKTVAADPALRVASSNAQARQSLPAKGSCWYCEKPLDNVRRFCGKPCADGFDEEAEFTR